MVLDQAMILTLVVIGTYCSVELYKRLARRFGWPPTRTAVIRDLVALLIGTGAALLQQQASLPPAILAVVYAALGAVSGAAGNALGHKMQNSTPGVLLTERNEKLDATIALAVAQQCPEATAADLTGGDPGHGF